MSRNGDSQKAFPLDLQAHDTRQMGRRQGKLGPGSPCEQLFSDFYGGRGIAVEGHPDVGMRQLDQADVDQIADEPELVALRSEGVNAVTGSMTGGGHGPDAGADRFIGRKGTDFFSFR